MTDAFSGLGAVTQRFTPPFLTLVGSYGLSATRLVYYISSMRLRDLGTYLSIVEDLPTDLTTGWRLQELYQREIDWKRVKNDIVKEYLNAANKLKFFNALTVALLPRQKDGALLSSFTTDAGTESPWPSEVPTAGFTRQQIGAVELYPHTTASFAFIRWDAERAIAAVIDGQHRVAALREYANAPLTSVQLDTQIPVIFLLLDARGGTDLDKIAVAQGPDNKILHVVRELFIDLNKHAVEVSRARQILMDDRDISSIGLRGLLAERAAEYNPKDRRIPLGVVDWQSDKAKFEKGPFITTVVLLQICLEDMLALQIPKDPIDSDHIDNYVQSVEDALGIDALIGSVQAFKGLTPLKKYVESEFKQQQRPLTGLPTAYLTVADYAFAQKWKPYIERVFLDFRPYKAVLERAYALGALDGEWAKVAALPKRAFENYWTSKEEDAREKLIGRPTAELESLKKDQFPFYGVFQKGILKATGYVIKHEDLLAPTTTTDRRSELANEWIALLNHVDSKGYLKKDAVLSDGTLLWSGIVLRDKVIKWSGPAASAIAALFLVWFFRRRDHRKRDKSFLAALRDHSNANQFPDFVGKQAGKISATSWLGRLEAGLKAHLDAVGKTTPEAIERRLLDLIKLVEPTTIKSESEPEQEKGVSLTLPGVSVSDSRVIDAEEEDNEDANM